MMLVQTGEDNCAFRGKSQQERDVFDMSEILKDRLVFSVQTKLDGHVRNVHPKRRLSVSTSDFQTIS